MLTITTKTRRFVLKENEEQSEKKFNEIIQMLLEPGKASIQEVKHEVQKKMNEKASGNLEEQSKYEYKGFLYIHCPECGAERGLCSKKGQHSIHCDACGCNDEFKEPLIPMYVKCECGSSFKYMTNKKEEMFDMECINCKSPVPVKYNGKKGCYETILQEDT